MSPWTTFPYSCEIISRTAGTILDDYGNAQSTVGTVTTQCDLQQTGSDEPGAIGETAVTTWNLYLPIENTIDTGDAVVVNGRTYELVGDPWFADTGSTKVNHIEATVVRAPA